MTRPHPRPHGGFTLTELVIVAALITVLLALLLPALGAVRSQGEMAKSMSRMKQIHLWMTQYSADNRDHVLPSQFDYSDPALFPYSGTVRSSAVTEGSQHAGTWTDILWTLNSGMAFVPQGAGSGVATYTYDSPDQALYDNLGKWDGNPFRAATHNTREVNEGTGPLPFGTGAQQSGYPGFFAANNFFNVDPADLDAAWYTNGQIRFPSQSMYLVDSYAGEIIEDDEAPFGEDDTDGDGFPDMQVDFRYGGDELCLMLFLDGHAEPQSRWVEIGDLESASGGRQVRIQDLTSRSSAVP